MGFASATKRWLIRIFGTQTVEIQADGTVTVNGERVNLSGITDAGSMIKAAEGARRLESEGSTARRLSIDNDPLVTGYHAQIEATNIALADRACGKVDTSGQPLTPAEGLQIFIDESYRAYAKEALERVKRGGPKGERI